ncbi:MAG: hypothetical protein H0W25_02395, partial [Acidimicrobiia bacterium]|nr:hypothetical protein [Acidimicrobiia bacterium]
MIAATAAAVSSVSRTGFPLRSVDAIAADSAAPADDSRELRRAVQVLHRRVGDERAIRLPIAAGRPALRLERLLAGAPLNLDPAAVPPGVAFLATQRLAAVAPDALASVAQEAEVLGEALSADVRSLGLVAMCDVGAAALALCAVAPAVRSWGSRAGADAAERVLVLAADDLRAAAASHTLLYERFAEDIWLVPSALLAAGGKRWRLAARARLRRRLRAT